MGRLATYVAGSLATFLKTPGEIFCRIKLLLENIVRSLSIK
jgi:hypothetical protein